MDIGQGMFSIKLCELCRNYATLQNRIDICREADLPKLKEAISKIKDECAENDAVLKSSAKNGKNPASAAISKVYLEFSEKISDISESISGKSLFDKTSPKTDDAEGSILFAEYAIDFASQAMRQATLAAVNAIYKEKELEKEGEK